MCYGKRNLVTEVQTKIGLTKISRDRQLRKTRANNSSAVTSWRNLKKHYDELAEFLHDR